MQACISARTLDRDHKTHPYMQSSTAILHPSGWHREARFLQGTKDPTLPHRDQDCVTNRSRLETSQSHLIALSEGRCPHTWIQTSRRALPFLDLQQRRETGFTSLTPKTLQIKSLNEHPALSPHQARPPPTGPCGMDHPTAGSWK